jgi:hypothetical protein
MHYRASLTNPREGRFRSACGQTVSADESTIELAAVDCEECRATRRFKHNEQVLQPPDEPQE